MRILVTGAGGRLGGAIRAELASAGHTVAALGRAELDIRCEGQVRDAITKLGCEVIVNCSAYNDVDGAEANREAAFSINAHGPAVLAEAASAAGVILVHYGTDFVFDGTASEPYGEDDLPNPLNVYGASKLCGETAVRLIGDHYILRVESLFGGSGIVARQATVDWIAAKLRTGAVVHAVADRTVSPSYVFDVARATRTLLEYQAPFGTYHCVNSGSGTWYELAVEIADLLGIGGGIGPVTAADLKTSARRPKFCSLSNLKLFGVGVPMPAWQAALRRHLLPELDADTHLKAGAA